MRRISLIVLAGLMLGLFVLPLAADAHTKTVTVVPKIGDEALEPIISVTTPVSYSSCTARGDDILIEHMNPNWYLEGRLIVDFVDGPNRINYSTTPVNTSGSSSYLFQVSYPPVSEWPTPEIHVDIQLQVWTSDPNVEEPQAYMIATLGPGSDWDVYCADRPTETPPPPPPPPGTEGCTPGYWKNHLEAWGATGYAPGADFDTTFGVNLFDPNITLETAVNLGGGNNNRLARHGVAALLSAAHPGVDYPYSVAEVIALVQAGNADALEAGNELGCPL